MAVSIINKAKNLIIVTLNSGKTLYLAPGKSSPPIEEAEINGNEKVIKLLKSHVIAMTAVNITTVVPSAVTAGKESDPLKKRKKDNK